MPRTTRLTVSCCRRGFIRSCRRSRACRLCSHTHTCLCTGVRLAPTLLCCADRCDAVRYRAVRLPMLQCRRAHAHSKQAQDNHVAPLHVAAVAFTANWRAEAVGEEREHLRTASAAGTCRLSHATAATRQEPHPPQHKDARTRRLCLCSSQNLPPMSLLQQPRCCNTHDRMRT